MSTKVTRSAPSRETCISVQKYCALELNNTKNKLQQPLAKELQNIAKSLGIGECFRILTTITIMTQVRESAFIAMFRIFSESCKICEMVLSPFRAICQVGLIRFC